MIELLSEGHGLLSVMLPSDPPQWGVALLHRELRLVTRELPAHKHTLMVSSCMTATKRCYVLVAFNYILPCMQALQSGLVPTYSDLAPTSLVKQPCWQKACKMDAC